MAATLYTAFLPEVSPHCEGAPETQVVNAIRNAAIEFCEKSWVYIYDLEPFPIAANVQDYEIAASDLPATTVIAQILYGYYNGIPVPPVTRDMVMSEFPRWRTQTGQAPTHFLANDAAASVSLIPIPNGNYNGGTSGTVLPNGMTFTVALKPTRASTGVPSWIYERYLEDIAKGALFRLYAMPKKFWTNANLAAVNKTLFNDAISKARNDAAKSFTRATNRNRNTGVARW
jgi:hypothetical protein